MSKIINFVLFYFHLLNWWCFHFEQLLSFSHIIHPDLIIVADHVKFDAMVYIVYKIRCQKTLEYFFISVVRQTHKICILRFLMPYLWPLAFLARTNQRSCDC